MKKTIAIWSLMILAFAGSAGCRKSDAVTVRMSQMQTCLWFADGTKVYIDVISGSFLADNNAGKDLLAVTFTGPDHYDVQVADSFQGKKLLFEEGVLENGDTRVELIPAARNEGDPITSVGATDYLVLVTSGEWRILYCGDLGQEKFTEEQKARIGEVDLCFASLENVQWCNMTLKNRKGFNLIEEINPRIVIPLRYKDRSLEYALTLMPVQYSARKPFSLKKKELPEKTTLVLVDETATAYGKQYGLTAR